MKAFYNEIDPYAAQWIRKLIDAGEITPGVVDERSIADLTPDDIVGFDRVHFFAGIGGWERALRLAGFYGPCWTGSCPCQPFSAAGKRAGVNDERHLWPEMFRLVSACRPSLVFGEQVASKDGLGWLDGVCADLEGADYSWWAADLCSAGIGAPHIRQRLYWVADAERKGEWRWSIHKPGVGDEAQARWQATELGGCRDPNRLADTIGIGQRGRSDGDSTGNCGEIQAAGRGASGWKRIVFSSECDEDGNCPICGIDYSECSCLGPTQDGVEYEERDGVMYGRLVNSIDAGPQGFSGDEQDWNKPGRIDADQGGPVAASGSFSDSIIIHCLGDKYRRISAQPGDEPLAYGLPRSVGQGSTKEQRMELMAAKANRKGRLRGYGNAIDPRVAAEFIRCCM